MISNDAEEITWVVKEKKMYSTKSKKLVPFKFLCFSISNNYNFEMNDNDIVNQLQLQYHMMNFTCNTKWWWELWLWWFEVSLVNSYKMYQQHHEDQGWPVEFTHYEFIKAVAHAWIDPVNCWPTRNHTTLKLLEKKLKRRKLEMEGRCLQINMDSLSKGG